MTASLLDSPLYARLFPTGEARKLFSDTAVVRAMLLVEGALAKAQGARGIIPEVSAAAIARAAMEAQIDPAALAQQVGIDGVPMPALLTAFRAEMNAPEHAQYVHWGATSQDIIDTSLMLRLRQVLALAEADLRALLATLAAQAEAHAELPMMARTYGQHAVPTTWGSVLASWGQPLADALEELESLHPRSLWVSLSGAAGTGSALGAEAPALRADLADALGLHDPRRTWHTDRTPVLRIGNWFAGLCTPLGGFAQSLLALTASEVSEVSLDKAGGSSTMPQKQNPVGPSALLALCRAAQAGHAALVASSAHSHQRDGAAWFGEWLALPQMTLAASAALRVATLLDTQMQPRADRMQATLTGGLGLYAAEALSFALAADMGRTDAQQAVKALCAQAISENKPLSVLALSAHPDLPQDLFNPEINLGQAPADARAFAARVRAL